VRQPQSVASVLRLERAAAGLRHSRAPSRREMPLCRRLVTAPPPAPWRNIATRRRRSL